MMTYRYNHVRGSDCNQYPRLAFEFKTDDFKTLHFRVARCSENDNFSYAKAKEILSQREWVKIQYDPKVSLVENAVEYFDCCQDQYSKLISSTYDTICYENYLRGEKEVFFDPNYLEIYG